MFSPSDISIKSKLIIMQVFTSVLVLSIFFGVFVYSDISSYKQRKAKSMMGLIKVIGTNSISTLRFQDSKAAEDILSELRNVAPEIIHALILDKKGKLFAQYKKPGSDSSLIPPSLTEKGFVFTDKLLFVNDDIIDGNEIIGKVTLVAELSELTQIKQSMYRMATLLIVVALGFSVLIAIAIQAFISKRLLHLVGVMKEVSKTGDYSRSISDAGKDEISTLIGVFNNLMQQVKKNQERKDEFIGIASHELKTPLTSIKGYTELLYDLEDRQPNKQFVQKVLENINKLENLIKDLLDVSKIQSGQMVLNKKEFTVHSLLEETVAAFQIVSKTHEISMKDDLDHETVFADRQRIEQVLFNLLSNAVKYSPGEKKVIVSTEKNGLELIIKVRDFGIGVQKEERSNIFERFYRSKDMTVHISGFGLGLYICRDIIERHHGRIWVETEKKGSSFCFSLPLQKMQEN